MEPADKNYQPLVIFLIVVTIMILLSFIPQDARIGQYYVKPVDMFSDIKPDAFDQSN